MRSEELPQAIRIPQLRADVTPMQEQFQSRPSHIHKGGVEPFPTPLLFWKVVKYSSRPFLEELQSEVKKFGVLAEGHQNKCGDRRPASVVTNDHNCVARAPPPPPIHLHLLLPPLPRRPLSCRVARVGSSP